jgi:hypothetical protein
LRRLLVCGTSSPRSGSAARHAWQLAQYTPADALGRSHNPPQRSQYFSSTWISWPSILPMKFMIASLYEMKIQNKKALAPISSAQGSFLLR